jgi:hypothetical protein
MNTVAFDSDGRCLWVVNAELSAPDAAAVVYTESSVDPNVVWYDHSSQTMKTRTTFPHVVALNQVSGLPVGTVVIVDGEQVPVDDGAIEFDVTYAQQLQVVLSHVKHIDTIVEVPCEVQG